MDPRSEAAWVWLAELADDDQERAEYLERVVDINPGNQSAKERLEHFTGDRLPPGGASDLAVPGDEEAPSVDGNEEQLKEAQGGASGLPEQEVGDTGGTKPSSDETVLKPNGQLANVLDAANPGPPGTTCSKCGADNPDGYAFCGMCGADLSLQLPADASADGATCPSCGFLGSATDEFCGQCGTRLAAALLVKDETERQTTAKPSVDAPSIGSQARDIIIALSMILMAVVTAVYFLGALDPWTALVVTVIVGIPGLWARFAMK